MRRFAAQALALCWVVPAAGARAESVVLFPLDARGVAVEKAERATQVAKKALAAIKGMNVIESTQVEKRLGVQLNAQARACEYDTFCLVEVGELLQSQRILVGHVRRAKEKGEELELKLVVLDVAKAAVVDVLVWRVPDTDENLDDAVRSSARRLFAYPDAKLVFEIEPKGAEISVYGDPVKLPERGPLLFWSGVYVFRFRADAFQPLEQRVVVPEGGPTRVPIQLQPDLLWTGKPRDPKAQNPFGKASRREGSGVSSEEVAKVDPALDEQGSALANPVAWALGGAGAALVVVGAVLMSGAQADYNSLAGDARYAGSVVTAEEAIERRDAARSKFSTGSWVVGGGLLGLTAGAAWMILDAATRPPSAPPLRGSNLSSWVGTW